MGLALGGSAHVQESPGRWAWRAQVPSSPMSGAHVPVADRLDQEGKGSEEVGVKAVLRWEA